MLTLEMVMRENIRVLLVDDHRITRASIASLLKQERGLEIIGEASDGLMAVRLAKELQPDVIIMDEAMPVMNGIEATRLIMMEFPHIKVIGFSMHAEGEIGAAMQKAGAIASISKSQPAERLISEILGCRPACNPEKHPETELKN
jgi:DNA-binding NarL/FixJ family response regulator